MAVTARRSYLDEILAYHRAAAAADGRDPRALAAAARALPPPRPFARALAGPGVAVIAEVKRKSPRRGPLSVDLDPAALACAYERGGAACLSVLTDGEFFGGSPADLAAARAATALPVLRKDFTVCAADVYDARLMGADAVLLIVAALRPHELARLLAAAREVGLDALVEVHDEPETDMALAAGATIVGVNQRDLYSFEVDRARAERVAKMLPTGVLKVAESGIGSADDIVRLGEAGFDAVLVGEALVTAADPQAAVARLVHRSPKA